MSYLVFRIQQYQFACAQEQLGDFCVISKDYSKLVTVNNLGMQC